MGRHLPRITAAISALAGIALTIGAPVLIVASVSASEADRPLHAIGVALIIIELVAFLRSPLRYFERSTQHGLIRISRQEQRRKVVTSLLSWPYGRWLDRRGYEEVNELLEKSGAYSEYLARFIIPYHASVVALGLAGGVTVLLHPWTSHYLLSFAIIATTALCLLATERLMRTSMQREQRENDQRQIERAREWNNLHDRSLTWSLLGGELSHPSASREIRAHRIESQLEWTTTIVAGVGGIAAVVSSQFVSHGSPTVMAATCVAALWLFDFARTVTTYAVASTAPRQGELTTTTGQFEIPLDEVVRIGDREIPPGTHVAVTGPSGSGKSTLLRALMGCDWLPQHPVTIGGRVPSTIDHEWMERHVAWVPSDVTYRAGTAGDLYSLGRTDCLPYATWQGLGLPASTTPGSHLSDGQLRRLAVARALGGRPAVVLLDEPTATLDGDSRRAILTALSSFAGTAIIATHDEDVAALCTVTIDLSAS